MKNLKKVMIALMVSPILLTSCDPDDDNNNGPEEVTVVNSKEYDLGSVSDPDISGTALFKELSDGTLEIDLDLDNTDDGSTHPAHIHFNTAAEGGGIALSLTPVDGETGESTTNFTALNDGTVINYDQLLDFDGYINVHLSVDELSTLIAQGDIGQNELTGRTKSYDLEEKDDSDVSGTFELAERVNGTTLATIELDGTEDGDSHPAHIHENDVATTGPIIVGLNAVNGASGISKTQIEELVGGAAVSYDDLLDIDAYVNIHLSAENISTVIAQGNIGSNEGVSNGGDDDDDTAETYSVTNSGASAYIFNGEDLSNASNPNIELKRGGTYTFNVNAPGHPFYINSTQGTGTGNAFNDGVTNNGAVNGTVTFTVPDDAPDTLYYNCEFHGSMTGTFNVTD